MESTYSQVAELFKALAHPTRLQILDLLREGEMCVCHIEAAMSKRQAYVSQQLMTLREAGLVDTRRDGLQVYYRLNEVHTADLLNITLGTSGKTGIQRVEGCACPACSVIAITEIR
ncbi:MAG: metalloregulator ArsR/SmtB family transcription factor [Anaerolineaceae bacterium]|nr:metalloregulator ArsR/SmtB family transcription factor [Anaerolineaceae bacterium]